MNHNSRLDATFCSASTEKVSNGLDIAPELSNNIADCLVSKICVGGRHISLPLRVFAFGR